MGQQVSGRYRLKQVVPQKGDSKWMTQSDKVQSTQDRQESNLLWVCNTVVSSSCVLSFHKSPCKSWAKPALPLRANLPALVSPNCPCLMPVPWVQGLNSGPVSSHLSHYGLSNSCSRGKIGRERAEGNGEGGGAGKLFTECWICQIQD